MDSSSDEDDQLLVQHQSPSDNEDREETDYDSEDPFVDTDGPSNEFADEPLPVGLTVTMNRVCICLACSLHMQY
jgi:hypothetical protein